MTIDEHIRRQEAGELPEGYPVTVRKVTDETWAGYEIRINGDLWARIPMTCHMGWLDRAERAAMKVTSYRGGRSINKHRATRGGASSL